MTQQAPAPVLQAAQPTAGKVGWGDSVKTGLGLVTIVGLVAIIGFMVGFGIWAARAPLAGAAVASGTVAASGQNLVIQHLEGGIVKSIQVREGERVAKGDVLLELDPTDARSMRNRMSNALIALRASQERLQAERDGQTDFDFSPQLLADAEAANRLDDLREQMREFEKRRDRFETDVRIQRQRLQALDEQMKGQQTQLEATQRQIAATTGELESKRKLLDRKLIARSEILALESRIAELEGRVGGYLAALGEARSMIVETNQRVARLGAERAEKAVTTLNETRRQIADTQERVTSAEQILRRVEIRSPADGVVVELAKNTPGSVVRPGEDLITILPTGGELIVEGRLSLVDVDVVHVGQTATLRFSALNTRTTPEVPATVNYISADRFEDERTNELYYLARLAIADTLPDDIERQQILPGMPVEIYIQTSERTFLEYLIKPIADSFRRAFREE